MLRRQKWVETIINNEVVRSQIWIIITNSNRETSLGTKNYYKTKPNIPYCCISSSLFSYHSFSWISTVEKNYHTLDKKEEQFIYRVHCHGLSSNCITICSIWQSTARAWQCTHFRDVHCPGIYSQNIKEGHQGWFAYSFSK